jgi:hypothetical protein
MFISPAARVLTPKFYLRGRYYDAIIAASILRAATRSELRSAITDPSLVQALSQRVKERASVELRSELALAMLQDKLPALPDVFQPDFFRGAETGIAKFFRHAFSTR